TEAVRQWPPERDGRDKRLLAFAPAEELFERLFALAEPTREDDGRFEREQRRRKIAVGAMGKQVAADGRGLAHRRTADRARDRMQKRKLAFGEDRRHGHAGAQLDPP